MNSYFNWLENEKCLSKSTILIYKKYLEVFQRQNFDIGKTLKVFSKSKNSTKRIILSSIKSYLSFYKDKRATEIFLPKKETKIQKYIDGNDYLIIQNYLNKKNNKNSILKLCLIRLLYETGIRSAELLSITLKDIQENKIVINGKGNKQRNIWVSNSLKIELDNYIKAFNITDRLFNFQYKNLYKKVRGIGKIINKKLTPHMFRRGFATYCIKKNIDIYSLSQMMGHSDLNTTKTYIYDFDLQSKMENLFQ